MTTTRPIVELPDDCAATLIPSGMTAILHAGDSLVVSQALGGSITVETPTGHLARIEARDLKRLGLGDLLADEPQGPAAADPMGPFSMETVTAQLSFITYAAERHSFKLAAERARDRSSERRFANARRSNE